MIRCSWLGHKWGKWSGPHKNNISESIRGALIRQYDAIIQERICDKCGKYDWREV